MKPAKAKAAPPKKAAAPNKTDTKKRQRVDKEAVERDYRLDKLTLRQVGDKHGVSHVTIIKWAKAGNWVRGDLQKVVTEATKAALVAATVNSEATRLNQNLTTDILATVELNKQVILRHRSDLSRTRSAAMAMLDELNLTTHKAAEIEELFDKVTEEISGPALAAVQQQFREFMRVHNRVGSVQKLADTLKKLQEREDVAFALYDKAKSGNDDLTELDDTALEQRIRDLSERRNAG